MNFLMFLSQAITPLLVFYILGFSLLSGRPVMDDFLEGAKEGMGTVEVILIILVLIGLVIIFKSQLTDLVESIFDKITKQAGTI